MGESGEYAYLLLTITLLTALTSYVQSVTGSVLLVKNRQAYVASSLVSSAAKLLVIPLIMLLDWSVYAVLWSTFLIVLSSASYSLAITIRFHKPSMDFKRLLKWSAGASWVSMMSSIADTISSLSTEVIGLLGSLIDLGGVWNVLRAIGRLFSMPNVIPSIMYGGELLERGGRLEVVYRDMLLSLFINTSIVLTVASFEPLIIDLLRPNDLDLIGPLYLPILFFLVSNTVSLVNTFTDNLISGVDKSDFKGEVGIGTYWGGTHIGFSKLLHLVRASLYIVLAIPIYFLIKHLLRDSDGILDLQYNSVLHIIHAEDNEDTQDASGAPAPPLTAGLRGANARVGCVGVHCGAACKIQAGPRCLHNDSRDTCRVPVNDAGLLGRHVGRLQPLPGHI